MTGGSSMEESEVELIDYLNVLWKWRWLIVIGTLACALLGGLVGVLLPRTYRIGATIETGDLGDVREKDVERLVVAINAGGGPGALTAQFKKPSLIELRMESEHPADAVKVLERAAGGMVDELNQLLKSQQDEARTKENSIRTQIETAKHETQRLHAQLRAYLDGWIRVWKEERESIRNEEEQLKEDATLLLSQLKSGVGKLSETVRQSSSENQIQLTRLYGDKNLKERRVGELRQSLEALQRARAEALHRAVDPAGVLVLTQLSNEIAAKEAALAEMERQLTLQLPMQVQELENHQRKLRDRVQALGAAQAALDDSKGMEGPQRLEEVRKGIYESSVAGVPDVQSIEPIFQRLSREIPTAVKSLAQRKRTAEEKLKVLESALSVLRTSGELRGAQALEEVQEAIYRAVGASSPEADFAGKALRRLDEELPQRVRALELEASALARKAAAIRPARLLKAPENPGAPTGRRLGLDVAVGLVSGLIGSLVLAFFAEYLQGARTRRRQAVR